MDVKYVSQNNFKKINYEDLPGQGERFSGI